MRSVFVLAAVLSLGFIGCRREQNFEVVVRGQVTDESGHPVPDVKVFIDAGVNGYYIATAWGEPDDSLLTNQQGAYSYIISGAPSDPYRVYIEVTAPYRPSVPESQKVNRDVAAYRTQPNTINFKLHQ